MLEYECVRKCSKTAEGCKQNRMELSIFIIWSGKYVQSLQLVIQIYQTVNDVTLQLILHFELQNNKNRATQTTWTSVYY